MLKHEDARRDIRKSFLGRTTSGKNEFRSRSKVVLPKNHFRLDTLPYKIYSALQHKYGIRSTPKYKIQLTLIRDIKEVKYVI